MNRFIYHYMARSVQNNIETTYDGIAQLENRIVDMVGYNNLKSLVGEENSTVKVCIVSLAFLGMEKDS